MEVTKIFEDTHNVRIRYPLCKLLYNAYDIFSILGIMQSTSDDEKKDIINNFLTKTEIENMSNIVPDITTLNRLLNWIEMTKEEVRDIFIKHIEEEIIIKQAEIDAKLEEKKRIEEEHIKIMAIYEEKKRVALARRDEILAEIEKLKKNKI